MSARKPIGESVIRGDGGVSEIVLTYAIVAVGAEEPLAEHMMVADFFRKLNILKTNGKREWLTWSRWDRWAGRYTSQRKLFVFQHDMKT